MSIHLRKLEKKDISYMLEWMHDENVVHNLRTNFNAKTCSDCERFIEQAISENCIHMAITDETDEYMGTVSLKNIRNAHAEFAITIRTKSMGKGYAKVAMDEIIRIAFEQYKLEYVYWCVDKNNIRARKFYEKNMFSECDYKKIGVIEGYSDKEKQEYIWYKVNK